MVKRDSPTLLAVEEGIAGVADTPIVPLQGTCQTSVDKLSEIFARTKAVMVI